MQKVVFITGISSGFGKATASLLAEKGLTVYGTCRSACESHPKVHVLQADVTDGKTIDQAIRHVLDKEGRIDVLINNAGTHTGGPLEIFPEDGLRYQLEVNFFGVVRTTRAVLPAMRAQGGGTIINISSIGGLMALPFQGYYSSAKFAVEGFSEALRMEVRPFGIHVVVINPGDFHTANTANRKNIGSTASVKDYEEQFRITHAVFEKDENGGGQPEVLARKIYRILLEKKPSPRYIIASAEQKLAVFLDRILPESWWDAILRSHYHID